MSIISANTLFHFTKKNALLAILETGFRPSYCREQFNLADPGDNTIPDLCYVPMVCFCDIPLSQIEQHVKEYGEFGKGYGIGLSVEWGLENDISPVTYVPVRNTEASQISTSIYTLHQNILSFLAFSIGVPNAGEDQKVLPPYKRLLYQINPELLLLMAYLKPYKGEQNGKPRKFYDEKEWRYVPSVA